MNIKARIKEYGSTLAELSKLLYISRPTLNNYIEMYEKNEIIPNEKYQIVFDDLFKEELSQDSFNKYVCRFNNLITKDELLGTTELNPVKTDTIYFLIEEMRRDLYNDDSNENIYIFIRLLLNSYRKVPEFQELINYFLTLNGLLDFNKFNIDEQNILSIYYEYFKNKKDNKIEFNVNKINDFKSRIKKLENERKREQEKLENIIQERVKSEIKKQIVTGKTIDQLSTKDILKNVEN